MSNQRHLGIKRSMRYCLAQSYSIIFESLINVKISLTELPKNQRIERYQQFQKDVKDHSPNTLQAQLAKQIIHIKVLKICNFTIMYLISSIRKEKLSHFSINLTQHQHLCYSVQFISVAQSCLTLRPHESQHARPPCPSQTPGVDSDSCPLSW